MKAQFTAFGAIEIDGQRYAHDVGVLPAALRDAVWFS